MSSTLPPPDPVPATAPGGDGVVAAFAVSAGITAITGAAAGLVWGGIGGRIAMRIVLLTSSDRVRGLTSDDGFEIGTISGATVFLLIFTTILGAIAGLGIGVLRMVTAGPTWAVAAGTSVATATLVGASIVHTDGVDFRFLDPLWLTVGLFVLIPGLWGATVIVATDRVLRSERVTGLPAAVHRRYWGVIGWMLLGGLTLAGVRDLVEDITRLR